jgi:ribosomal protein S18 acetylase RimI-like enzyme
MSQAASQSALTIAPPAPTATDCMLMEITTRPATVADTEFARGTHHQAYRDLTERRFGQWIEQDQDAFFTAAWTAGAYSVFLCDGTVCGYVCIETDNTEVHVREIVIVPSFQGRGIGSLLLQQAIDLARQRQVPVRLRTAHVNRAAILYRRLGFREMGRTQSHIQFEWRDQVS